METLQQICQLQKVNARMQDWMQWDNKHKKCDALLYSTNTLRNDNKAKKQNNVRQMLDNIVIVLYCSYFAFVYVRQYCVVSKFTGLVSMIKIIYAHATTINM